MLAWKLSGGLSAARKELLGVGGAEILDDAQLPWTLKHGVGQSARGARPAHDPLSDLARSWHQLLA